jgi:addiction module HigA family antidote
MTNGESVAGGSTPVRATWKSLIITTEVDMTKTLPPVHPGEVLLEDFMKPLGLSAYRVAKDIGVATLRVSQIVRGQRAVTADTALRLARYFGTSAEVWMRLQAQYNLEVARQLLTKRVEREVKILQHSAA